MAGSEKNGRQSDDIGEKVGKGSVRVVGEN